MRRKILVIAAHPDDEILGCGGTLILHSRAGDEIHAVIAAEGESLRYGVGAVNQAKHIENAAKICGISSVHQLGFLDQKLDTHTQTDIISPIEKIIREVRPSIIYVQWGGDVNKDHQILFQAQLVATRPTELGIQKILAFDTASSTEWAYPRSFVPDTWVDIASSLEGKINAFACYESEVRDYPHPRSLQALRNRAIAWGNQVCLEAAEPFMTIRSINRDGQTPS